MRAPPASWATGPVPGAHDISPTSPPNGEAPRMQWPAVAMYVRPSLPANTKLKVHCPTSLFTMAPGRTPGQAVTPTGAAVGTSMSQVGTPPSVQFGGGMRDAGRRGSPAWAVTATARATNAAATNACFRIEEFLRGPRSRTSGSVGQVARLAYPAPRTNEITSRRDHLAAFPRRCSLPTAIRGSMAGP